MGGTLTTWLATRHPEIVGLVLVNPAVEPLADSFVDVLKGTLESGIETIPGIASDIAKPGVAESAYAGTPVAPLISLIAANNAMAPALGEIRCPILLLTSRNDHVVPTTNGDWFTERVSGPVERVWLERSFHVATLDHDKEEIEQRAVEFARKVTAA
jgi:carboxylesterase